MLSGSPCVKSPEAWLVQGVAPLKSLGKEGWGPEASRLSVVSKLAAHGQHRAEARLVMS